MDVLGINTMENASACLIRDGRILAAVEEERYTRVKHQEGVPVRSIQYCLSAGGIGLSDVDVVALNWQPWRIAHRFWHVCKFTMTSPKHFIHKAKRGAEQVAGDEWRRMLTLPRKLPELIGEDPKRCKYLFRFMDHHQCHAASAFYPSGFDKAAILTLDGAGESACTTFARGQGAGIDLLRTIRLPHSLGHLYAAGTAFLGFRVCSGEGKVMGLASYGKNGNENPFRQMVTLKQDGDISIDFSSLDYHLARSYLFNDKARTIFGQPRAPEGPVNTQHQNLAYCLQSALEEATLHLANHLYQSTGLSALCLAGGVAMNSKNNREVLQQSPFSDVFIQPAAGDNGTCIGAALAAAPPARPEDRVVMNHAYLGPEFTDDEIKEAIDKFEIESTFSNDICKTAAELLADGQILGWFQGKMEFGARALGCRSILADPRRAEMKDILNARVKHRESFRPFAPSALEERADEYFEPPTFSPFMIQVVPVKPLAKKRIPATVHVDDTARLQTVSSKTNPLYYRLIEQFDKLTGVPVVLNTSFNVRGEPIVCTPEDAIKCFLGTEMDALAIGSFLVRKK